MKKKCLILFSLFAGRMKGYENSGNSYCWGWSDRVLYGATVEEMWD